MTGHVQALLVPRVPSPAAAHIGRQFVAHRKACRLTQDQLAAKTGIDSANLRAYENGRALPSIYSLVRIAAALEVSPGVLIEGLTSELFDSPGPS